MSKVERELLTGQSSSSAHYRDLVVIETWLEWMITVELRDNVDANHEAFGRLQDLSEQVGS